MKKRILAMLCALLLLAGTLPAASALEGEAERAADTLAALNLLSGSYALKDPATKAQAAVLLVRLAGAEKSAAASTVNHANFRAAPDWARASIAYAARQGWITSTTAQGFRAETTVTGDDFCAMLLRMLGYSDKNGDFAAGEAARFARHIGLTARNCQGALTRGDLFQIMRDALTFPRKDGSGTVAERLVSAGVCTQAAAGALGLLDRELTAREAADRHMAAVFCMEVYERQKEIDANIPSSNSSGFFIAADGLAVTNYHSIEDAIYALVTLATGEVYPVESVLFYDPEMDIAVIQVSQTSLEGKTTSGFAALELVGAADARPGDVVYTLGNPLGMGLAVSSGIVGSTDREVEGYTLPCLINTADISHGSSGGALLNVYGQVLAVTTGAYTRGNNMYIAVPVEPVMTADLTANRWTLEEVKEIETAKAEAAKAEEAKTPKQ
ncbi:MAG: trypsin-like peptidase domain-containing protein [Oscillibacter sp.]|nr:trypsin-like peptidase domain-containing protein [Oscillibacter sp.]